MAAASSIEPAIKFRFVVCEAVGVSPFDLAEESISKSDDEEKRDRRFVALWLSIID
jgi:hypothetical protein